MNFRVAVFASIVCVAILPLRSKNALGQQPPYPYAGIFHERTTDGYLSLTDKQRALLCYSRFFIQRPDGTYTAYSVSQDSYFPAKKIVYLIDGEGRCEFDADSKTERCKITYSWLSNASDSFGRIENADIVGIRVKNYTSLDNFLANKQANEAIRIKCPFTEKAIQPYLTQTRIKESASKGYPDDWGIDVGSRDWEDEALKEIEAIINSH